jgi:thioredoxin reductase (NADPH)
MSIIYLNTQKLKGMMIIDGNSAKILKEKFKDQIKRNVEIKAFLEEKEKISGGNKFLEEFLNDLKELSSEKILPEIFYDNSNEAKKFGIERRPTILIDPNNSYKIVYLGLPLGHEAWAFIDTIIQVSKDESLLSENSKKKLKDLKEKREIITFVTPTCPYCPYQVFLSNNLAIEAKGIITSICIDALEFPELADKFEVSSVPHNVINGKTSSIGVQPEEKFVEDVIKGG